MTQLNPSALTKLSRGDKTDVGDVSSNPVLPALLELLRSATLIRASKVELRPGAAGTMILIRAKDGAVYLHDTSDGCFAGPDGGLTGLIIVVGPHGDVLLLRGV